MSQQRLLLTALLPFLFLLPTTTSSHCQTFHRSACMKQDTFVPGHNYIGEGVDITSLERKGAYVVDTGRWQGPNGTCKLCRNPLMNGHLQKLPLAGVDWQVVRSCHRQVSSSVENLDVDVANTMAMEVKNDWKVDLGLEMEMNNGREEDPGLPKARVAFAGSRSRMAIYAHEKSREDSYSFVRQEVSCAYYRMRLLQRPSLLASHFSRAVARLPRNNNSEEYQHFINIYGTHYISHVQLGGRLRHLLAVQTCKMALWGITASTIQRCLNWGASLGVDWLFGSTSLSSECEDLKRAYSRGILEDADAKQHIEVVGGDKQVEMLFSKAGEAQLFSAWMESAKTKPGLVSYSLLPLHTLLNQRDPRRDLLKQAIVGHINQRALKRDCPQQCPRWSSQSSGEQCTCLCQQDGLNNEMCCAWQRGRARLKFVVVNGSRLWGDHFTATDAYVRILFKGQEMRTSIITDNDNPQWSETLDYGTVTLADHNSFKVQLWDEDVWHDDLLQSCFHRLEAKVGTFRHRCYAPHGYIEYYYLLECGHTLGGPSCQNYVPLRLPTSHFN
nr:perforin-1-like [Zootoca vivipara]